MSPTLEIVNAIGDRVVGLAGIFAFYGCVSKIVAFFTKRLEFKFPREMGWRDGKPPDAGGST